MARLTQIVESNRRAGRDKDRPFFAAHADAIRDLMALADIGEHGKPTAKRRSRRQGKKRRLT